MTEAELRKSLADTGVPWVRGVHLPIARGGAIAMYRKRDQSNECLIVWLSPGEAGIRVAEACRVTAAENALTHEEMLRLLKEHGTP